MGQDSNLEKLTDLGLEGRAWSRKEASNILYLKKYEKLAKSVGIREC